MSAQPQETQNSFARHVDLDVDCNVFSPSLGGIDATAAAHTRFGEAVIRLEGLAHQLDRAFTRLEETTEQMLAAGVRVEPILPAHVEAALKAWKLEKVSDEAPLPVPIVGEP